MAMPGIEATIEDLSTRVATLPRSMWRRRDTALATLPGGIRLAVLTSPFIVRWAAWLVALLILLFADIAEVNERFEPWLALGTLVQTALVTFYVPVIRPVLLPVLRRYVASPENSDVLVLGLVDLALSMGAVYLSGGWGSPYFHFALTALLIPAFFLTFRGVVVLVGAYMALYVLALATVGEGVYGGWTDDNLNSFIGAMVTPALVALVPNYLGSVLRELEAARRDAVEALGDSDLLFRVARAFLEGRTMDDVLPGVSEALGASGRFDRVAVVVAAGDAATVVYGADVASGPEAGLMRAAFPGEGTRSRAPSTLPAPLHREFAGYEWCGVAPLRSDDSVDGWIVAATRLRPPTILHDVRLLDAVAGQISIGMRNIRLSERIGELAAEQERTRIAREIHDGIAQMVYMLTLSLETASDRVGGDPEEQRRRLQDLTALAKNALWEVRQYIFDLRPLLSGEEGLVGALQGQVKEFQAVSDLPVELDVAGEPQRLSLAASAALYRIVQEGLGNIFRHAHASRVRVRLSFEDGAVALTIADDGVGIGDGDPAGRVGHGMGNLRRRVEDLNGVVTISSTPGSGTTIDVRLPVEPLPAGAPGGSRGGGA